MRQIHAGSDFIVMELVQGVDAGTLLEKEGRLTPGEAVHVIAQICDALVARRERWDASYLVVQGPEAMDAAAPIVARLAGT